MTGMANASTTIVNVEKVVWIKVKPMILFLFFKKLVSLVYKTSVYIREFNENY